MEAKGKLQQNFAANLKNPDSVMILATCLVVRTCDLPKKTREIQIKGKLVLEEFRKTVSFCW